MLPVVALATALIALPASATVANIQNIRTSTPFLAELIADTRAHSQTFAEMFDRVERSDVIVYFEPSQRADSGLRGCVHFMGTAGRYRYIRAQIKTLMNRFDVVASLAHELQHAIEIADHPEVRSEESLAELYRRIGSEREWRMFETDRAQTTGRAVRAEVLAAP
ncbi:MAG: hypothetical protein HYU53_12030 [Acidobacteria bacterium]|nr:hypothetical protein [Acidobacteriota bacterium]